MAEHIGTLREGPLHASLKRWYAEDGDLIEHGVDGLVVDLVRGDLLIEVQTGGFAPLRTKLARLLDGHRVRVVHPVAVDTWIVRVGEGGEVLSRRRSPKHGQVVDVFSGLVSIVDHLTHPRLEFDVISTRQEQVRRHEPGRAWRRNGWVVDHRSLVEVTGVTQFRSASDLAGLLPPDLASPFTTAELAAALGTGRRTAQQMVYCLRATGALTGAGATGRAPLYAVEP